MPRAREDHSEDSVDFPIIVVAEVQYVYTKDGDQSAKTAIPWDISHKLFEIE